MARRFQEITEVYRQELAALARGDRWTAFLRSACRNYKLHFEEQILVHAQRPDATAVLEMEHWNRRFDRWVDPGSTGIAVFDRDTPGRTRLKYYFDISDTHEGRFHRPVPLWQVSAEQEPEIVEALEHRFGALARKETLGGAIVSAMENAVTDNMADYLADLQQSRDGSFLEELDELNVKVLYRRLLENSTAYMLLCRCGLEPDAYFEPEDFSEVFNFNTPETMNALGVATRDIAESGLRAISCPKDYLSLSYEIVAAAMEMKRLGLCTKSLVVVPNHITEQWAAEWLQLYPAANILVATERDFEKHNRRRLCARIATGDYDAVIIGHSQLMKIPLSRERQREILQRQINEVLLAISDAKRQRAENFTIKQMERTRKSLEARLEKLNDQSTKDDTVTFEELGIDRLFIDESHNFKNLFLMTKMRNVGGIAQTEAQKSSDLFAKCQYLDELTDSHGVIFATGTPISNSMVELYTVQRYLQYQTLQEMGLIHFDDWASDYGETVTAIELSPEGSGYRPKTRFAKFFNLPELMATFKMVADVQTADMLKLPVPKANFHTEVIHPSELQKKAVAGLAERAERVRARVVDPSTDNMLRITNDGRKLALDMRLINPLAADDPNGKVATCARNVARIWAQTKDRRSTQLVFCDQSTPNKNAPIEMQKNAEGVYEMIPDQFTDVYNDLKKKLMAEGIPEEEIAFIHDAKTEQKKKELFAKVRGGEVRILMGSTAKMGAGTNVQDRLIALHDLECPWRPSDLQQRLGRIVRQGNQNPEVEIFRYVTEGTFDAYLYQLVESKQRFIAQIMTSKLPARAAEDVDETALSYAEIKALATGNPQIIEKCNLDMEVSKLNMLRASHLSQRYALEELVLRKYPAEIKELNERIAGYEQDRAKLMEHPKPAEGIAPMVLNGVIYTERENAGKAIIHACTHMNGAETIPVGSYRGFDMALNYDSKTNEFHMTLKGSLSHTAVLGADAGGNVTRIDNVLEKIDERLESARSQLAHTSEQLENARTEMVAPFPKEAELAEKTRRLNELNVLLNLNEPDRVVMSEEPDEGGKPHPRTADRER